MKSFFKRSISLLIAVLIISSAFSIVRADPEDGVEATEETSAETENTDIIEPPLATESTDNKIITLEDAPTAFLSEEIPDAPSVNGKAYLLFDSQSQIYLYGKDIDTPLEPASTTKLMTVLLAFENLKMDDVVTITPVMFNNIPDDYVKLGMTEGEEFKVEDLINAALLKSCNDATLALAIHMSGSELEFCKKMNARAKELGCTNTNFTTAYGLANPDNLISVHDMCKIMEKIIEFPEFTEISTSTQYEIASTNKYSDVRTIQNANRFISTQEYSYEYYIGGKTGYTDTAGNTIVAAARKNDRTLIGVIFGAEDSEIRYADLIKMFEYGFNRFSTVPIDEREFMAIYKSSKNQIAQLLVTTDLEITKYDLKLAPFHTTYSSSALTTPKNIVELSGVVIDPNLTLQDFSIPLYRRYNDGSTYEVGSIELEIGTKERLMEITPDKQSANFWAKFKKIIITVLVISALAIFLIIILFWLRKKNIERRDREFRNKSKML